jgi:uncharacterized membrane protein YeaQ/YmgE (transglycosylase-associated protein family)
MRSIFSIVFGALVGVSGTFLHNGYRPMGLIVSLIALSIGARLVRNMYLSKSANFLYAIAWLFVIVRASSLGNGGEILIEANLYGNLFVFGGLGLLAISLLRKNWR